MASPADPQTTALLRAVISWAKGHPDPNRPLLRILGTDTSLSPIEIARALETGSAEGRLVIRVLENAAKTRQIEEIIAEFDSAAARRREAVRHTAHSR